MQIAQLALQLLDRLFQFCMPFLCILSPLIWGFVREKATRRTRHVADDKPFLMSIVSVHLFLSSVGGMLAMFGLFQYIERPLIGVFAWAIAISLNLYSWHELEKTIVVPLVHHRREAEELRFTMRHK